MKIEVKEKHIKKGHKYSIFNCPISLAIQEKINNNYYSILVGPDNIIIFKKYRKGTNNLTINTPEDCINFMRLFDAETHVEPFSFELPLENLEKLDDD